MNIEPKTWGPHVWHAMHYIAAGYPNEPKNEDKLNYRNFFVTLGKVLPCSTCSHSYEKYILPNGEIELKDDDLINKASLCTWTYRLHERVNKKLCKKSTINIDEFLKLYVKTCDNNKCHTDDDSIFINEEYIYKLIPYACKRGVLNFQETYEMNKLLYKNKKNLQKLKLAGTLINKEINETKAPYLETDGEFIGLPSIIELISMSCLNGHLSPPEYQNIMIILDNFIF